MSPLKRKKAIAKYRSPRSDGEILDLLKWVEGHGRAWSDYPGTTTKYNQDVVRTSFDRLMKHYKRQGIKTVEEVIAFYEQVKQRNGRATKQETNVPQESHTAHTDQAIQGKKQATNQTTLDFDGGDMSDAAIKREFQRRGLDPGDWIISQVRFGEWGNEDNANEQFRITVKPKTQADFPIIQPIQVNFPFRRPPKRIADRGLKRALVFGDSQNGYLRDMATGKLDPFHDRLCWSIVTQLADYLEPDDIIILGDMLDLPDWTTRFLRSPECYWATQPALLELHWWLTQLRAASPDSEMQYLEGNHEIRMRTALQENVGAAHGLKRVDEMDGFQSMSVPNLLALDELGIEWVGDYPDGRVWLNDNLYASHGDVTSAQPGGTSGKIVKDARASSITGHIHRCEMASKTVFARRGAISYRSVSLGTMARIPGPIPARSKENNWQQAVGIVEYEPGNGLYEIHTVFINKGRAIWDGKVFEGYDMVKNIRDEIDWVGI